jgi:mono/diheme cytochrome c family protein
LALTLGAVVFSALAAENGKRVSITSAEAAADPDFALQGEYVGENRGLQVIAQGGGQFRAMTLRGGLPGAGWDGKERQDLDEDAAGVKDLIADLKVKKVERQSPTVGTRPPTGAVVLFDGTKESLQKHWREGARIGDDGLLMQGCTSVDLFQDCSLHIEFQLPYMPDARGQGRGNSGLYYQGRFETQMLDSFGLEGKDNECGGLYTIKAPDVNMCFPPLSWQTYDVDFTAARWKDGKKTANARVTVKHNGIVVQQDVELPKTTTGAPSAESPEPGPIYLQDHGNPVRYRNIWVLPRSAEQEALRPIVPGFERFYASTGASPADGGRLLLGELNCVACHKADEALAKRLLPRQAPILDEVGKRVHSEYLLKFLADPHAAKPGTTMPDLLAGFPAAERKEAVLALVNFLASTGTVAEQSSDSQSAQRGKKLFQEIGCVACHLPREGQKASAATSVSLVGIEAKYSIPSLTAFLQDPHKVRPSGRMPSLNLDAKNAFDVACYLLGDVNAKPKNPNMKFAAYHGSWDKIPNFDDLKPVRTGESAGLDLTVAGRTNDFGVRFEGFLKIDQPGEYTFHLGSDDGSRLILDGKKVVDVDGVHPHTEHSGQVKLETGMHPLRVDYTQGGGEWTLTLEYEGPKVQRQDAARAISMTAQGNPAPEPPPAGKEPAFVFNPNLVDRGRDLFASLGCANCHQLKQNGQPTAPKLAAQPLVKLDPARGCLAVPSAVPATAQAPAAAQHSPIPQFDLNWNQRAALASTLLTPALSQPLTPQQSIAQTLTAFNCYACHARDGVGGPERDRNPLFLTTIQEMGDEGRVPPPLDGVGDKLNDDWLKHVLQEGAHDRPYMLTRMPKFGMQNVGHLVSAFIAFDRKTAATIPPPVEAAHRIKASGRKLVGDKALSCIKCHIFGPHKATGIQALDLQTMSRRLREDWFFRYMIDPQVYRPGTRMPTGFPNGQAAIRDVYEGKPDLQLAAIWAFLKEGDKAGIPDGLLANVIELVPEKEPIIYRNFIEGLTPRGIAVGYPEKVHLGWDANKLSLTLVWHGRFMDAGKHWEGRGVGNQPPLGDSVMRLEETVPIAVLDSPNDVWPAQPPKERGYTFRGYRLDPQGRPHFRYGAPGFQVEDFPKPISAGGEGGFERHLTITSAEPVANLYFLAAAGQKIESLNDGWYLLNGSVRIRVPKAGGPPLLRESNGRQELLIPVKLSNGKAQIEQEIAW